MLALFGPLQIFVKTVSVPTLDLILTIAISFIIPLLVVEVHKKLAKS